MNDRDRRSEWTVLIGLGLVALGIYLFLGNFAGWLVAPIATIIRIASRVAWPLLIIAIGVLLVLRARGGGWVPSGRRLYRSRDDRMLAGVLAGGAKWLGVNPTPLRLVYAFVTLFTGFWPGIFVYFLGAVLLPEEPTGVASTQAAPPAPPVPQAPAPQAPVPPAPPAPPQDSGPVEAPTPPAAAPSAPEPAAPAAPAAPPVPEQPAPPAPPAS